MDDRTRDELLDEITALHATVEYLAGTLIAAHPDREKLLHHLRQYRAQTVLSKDRVKGSIDQLLGRVQKYVDQLDPSFPA